MKHLIIVIAFATAAGAACARTPAAASGASASSAPGNATTATAQPGTPQRSKMKACNADAKTKGVHGDERRAFMKQCLSGKAKAAATS